MNNESLSCSRLKNYTWRGGRAPFIIDFKSTQKWVVRFMLRAT